MSDTARLAPGDPAPAFSLPDAEGRTVSLSDYAGAPVIVYFYPKASTPGCTTQACDFRDNLAALQSHGYRVVGVSPDAGKALATFAEKQELPFPLLSDADHAVAEAYGAWGEKKNYGKVYEGLIRSTFVLDAEGRVEQAQYNVRAKGHVAKLRRDLGLEAPAAEG
ncbi:thioredoxin-dependent thiol peroxidase [Rothia sp. AR01]|uniref:thioredoxin-dependent peroxiredoxin n=1 Tax=Rothia santali TaxID=2949643 RepID=A0A9X2KHV1_9MICC|nr:thioredoxin-dependent thiol peroxidase [Rothia santali]MCP3426232.1 thioredoxin-dependent thiol peroxidase [Rothia santali]